LRAPTVAFNPGLKDGLSSLDQIGFDYTVLFPTAGQRIGRIVDRRHAAGALAYTTGSPKLTCGGFALQGHGIPPDA